MSSEIIIFLIFRLIIRIFKDELLLISIREVHKLNNIKSFNVIVLSPENNSSFLSNGTLI